MTAAERLANYQSHIRRAADLQSQGKFRAAVDAYRDAIATRPNGIEAHINLASILSNQNLHKEAVVHCKLALAVRPNSAEALINLGASLLALGQPDNAAEALRKAIAIAPQHYAGHANLAAALREMGETDAAWQVYDTILKLPNQPGLRPGSVAAQRVMMLPPIPASRAAMLAARDRMLAELRRLTAAGIEIADPAAEIGITQFYLVYQGQDDRDIQRQIAELYEKACPSLLYRAAHCAAPRPVRADGKHHVGFISSYFKSHTIGQLNRGLIANLDRTQFHVTVFAFDKPDGAIAQQIQSSADRVVVLPRHLARAREAIAAEALDLLHYADIGMDALTYFLAFARLAPVQSTSWGHPITTGLRNMDYFVSSALMEAEEAERDYTEKLVRFASLSVYYHRPPQPTPKPLSAWGLADDATVYLCPQSLFKFHPDFDAALAAILRGDPKARLVLIDSKTSHWATLLTARFKHSMPDVVDRITVLPKQSYENFLGLLKSAHVVLDTWPFGGGNSTLEAFAMGQPVVTLPGPHLAGRLTLGFYRRMSISELIAQSLDDFAALAVRLGTDPEFRATMRARIIVASDRVYSDIDTVRDYERFFGDAIGKADR
ncbi:MAG: tetratricopeptide repeat protein [Alphaproteobacteria bacterium]